MKKLYGTYANTKEAGEAVEELKKINYKMEEIDVFTKKEFDDLDISEYKEKTTLENYKNNLKENQIIVLVNVREDEIRETPDWDERENEFNEDLDS